MHTIKPIAYLTYNEIAELARAAADRGALSADENPFAAGTPGYLTFERQYLERERELTDLVTS